MHWSNFPRFSVCPAPAHKALCILPLGTNEFTCLSEKTVLICVFSPVFQSVVFVYACVRRTPIIHPRAERQKRDLLFFSLAAGAVNFFEYA